MAAAIRYDPVIDVDLAIGVGGVTVSNPGGGQISGSRINVATFGLRAQATFNPGAVAVNNVAVQQIACLGARIGYPCMVSFSGILGHFNNTLTAQVTVDDNVLITLINNDAGNPLTVGSGTARVFCFPVSLT